MSGSCVSSEMLWCADEAFAQIRIACKNFDAVLALAVDRSSPNPAKPSPANVGNSGARYVEEAFSKKHPTLTLG